MEFDVHFCQSGKQKARDPPARQAPLSQPYRRLNCRTQCGADKKGCSNFDNRSERVESRRRRGRRIRDSAIGQVRRVASAIVDCPGLLENALK